MDPAIEAPASILAAACKVLTEPDPWRKAALTDAYVDLWKSGFIPMHCESDASLHVPEKPARYGKVEVVDPLKVKKRGKGGSLASRQAILHSLAHIESWAIDLSWDVIARFGRQGLYPVPREFFDDFVQVAADECRHFRLLAARLEATGSGYGQLPAHDGLWESATRTAHSLPARLAVEHCVHEARGLDVLPQTIARFRQGGDAESASLLEDVIYPEEVTHCAAGVRWLSHLHRVAATGAHPGPSLPTAGPEFCPAPCNTSGAARTTAGEGEKGDMASAAASALGAGLHLHEVAERAVAHQHAEEDAHGASGNTAGAGKLSPTGAQHCQAEEDDCSTGHMINGRVQSQQLCSNVEPCWGVEARRFDNVTAWFHHLVRRYFVGSLKPPFNDAARNKAGFLPDWYLPLVDKVCTS